MRIVPHYRSLEIALYLPKRGVDADPTARCGYFSNVQFYESVPLGFDNRIAKGTVLAVCNVRSERRNGGGLLQISKYSNTFSVMMMESNHCLGVKATM